MAAAFRLYRRLATTLPGGRLDAFGSGVGQIGTIVVINLDRQHRRLTRTLRELSRFESADGRRLADLVTRLPAVDARDGRAIAATADVDPRYALEHQLHVQPDERLKACFGGAAAVTMTRQEVAVAKSHIEVWKAIVAGDAEHVLIVEDDIWFRLGAAKSIDRAWREATSRSDGRGPTMLYLSYEDAGGTCERADVSEHVFRPIRGLWFLCGYVISRRGAEMLLSAMPVVGPVDMWMNRQFDRIGALAMTKPAILQRPDAGSDNAYSVLPFLATAGIVDAQTLPGPVRPSKVRLIAWTRRGAREPLAMALSMLGLRVLACDGAETVTCGDALADLFDTFDAIVDPPFPPEELPARLEELATGLILEPSSANVVAPPHGRALAWTILPEDGPGDHWWPPICALTQTSAPTEPFPLGPPSDWRLFRDGRISVSFPTDDLSTASPLPMDDTPWAIANMEGWPIQIRKLRFPNFRDHLEERWPLTTPSSEMPAILGTFPGNRAMFRPDAVDHGALGAAVSLAPTDAGNRPFRSGALASTRRFLHGCFEIEMRAARGPGLVTGFFLHRSAPRQEIDVEITGNNLRRVLLNVYFNPGDEGAALDYGYRGSPHSIDLEFDASEAFHRYAIEWSPDRIRWFVDDILVHERGSWDPTPIPHLPMALHANLWAPRSVELAGAAEPSLQKATAYFRNATVSDQPQQPGDTKFRRA
nr:family 16 glycosylhydrolase [Qipengyuania sp. YIM B01966]